MGPALVTSAREHTAVPCKEQGKRGDTRGPRTRSIPHSRIYQPRAHRGLRLLQPKSEGDALAPAGLRRWASVPEARLLEDARSLNVLQELEQCWLWVTRGRGGHRWPGLEEN